MGASRRAPRLFITTAARGCEAASAARAHQPSFAGRPPSGAAMRHQQAEQQLRARSCVRLLRSVDNCSCRRRAVQPRGSILRAVYMTEGNDAACGHARRADKKAPRQQNSAAQRGRRRGCTSRNANPSLSPATEDRARSAGGCSWWGVRAYHTRPMCARSPGARPRSARAPLRSFLPSQRATVAGSLLL